MSLFAPGYTLLLLVNPRHLTNTTRYLASVPLSFVAMIIVGVALDASALGIQLQHMCVAIVAVTGGLSVALWLRSPGGDTWIGVVARDRRCAPPRQANVAAVTALLIALIVISSLTVLGLRKATRTVPFAYTELYASGLATSSAGASNDQPKILNVAVVNHEGRQASYRLRILVQGRTGKIAIAADKVLSVPAGATLKRKVPVVVDCASTVRVELDDLTVAEPPRLLRLEQSRGAASRV
jgi:uncharacterized membrane protein